MQKYRLLHSAFKCSIVLLFYCSIVQLFKLIKKGAPESTRLIYDNSLTGPHVNFPEPAEGHPHLDDPQSLQIRQPSS